MRHVLRRPRGFSLTRQEAEEKEWGSINLAKNDGAGMGDACGELILAGDGYVAPILKPTEEDLRGRDPALFRNRYGCWALVVQAFCDAYCRFRYFEVSWPGSTPDIT